MNDLVEVVFGVVYGHLTKGSRQPLLHIRHWISRKPLKIDAWIQ